MGGRCFSKHVLLSLMAMATTMPLAVSAKMTNDQMADHAVGAIYKSIRTVMRSSQTKKNVRAGATVVADDKDRDLAEGPGSLTTRCFTECIEQRMTPEECQTYIQQTLEEAGGHEVGDVNIKIQTPRTPDVFDETYWMIEVPVNSNGQFACDRNNGHTYYPYEFIPPDLPDYPIQGPQPVHDIDCTGLSAGKCCLRIRTEMQAVFNGIDINGNCLSCFPHQEPFVPVCNDELGTTEYQDYVFNPLRPDLPYYEYYGTYLNGTCDKVQLTEEEVLAADDVTRGKIELASDAWDEWKTSFDCYEMDPLLEKLYDASVVIPALPQHVGRLGCDYCLYEFDNITVASDLISKIDNLLSKAKSYFPPSTEKSIIIYTDADGDIVDIPKLGGSRADDPYDDDCEDNDEDDDNGGGGGGGGTTTCLPEATLQPDGTCQCNPGTFEKAAGSGGTICAICPARTISGAGASECTPCSEGYVEVDNVTCDICPSGTCQAGDLNECVPCELGLFQPLAGQNFCLQCPRGSYADEEGLVECKTCPEGSASQRGASECEVCIAPQVVSDRKSECVDP